MKIPSILVAAVLLLASGCQPPPADPQIPGRFAADVSCAREDVDVREISPNTFRARGCGRELTYTCVSDAYDRHFVGWSCIREAPLSASK